MYVYDEEETLLLVPRTKPTLSNNDKTIMVNTTNAVLFLLILDLVDFLILDLIVVTETSSSSSSYGFVLVFLVLLFLAIIEVIFVIFFLSGFIHYNNVMLTVIVCVFLLSSGKQRVLKDGKVMPVGNRNPQLLLAFVSCPGYLLSEIIDPT